MFTVQRSLLIEHSVSLVAALALCVWFIAGCNHQPPPEKVERRRYPEARLCGEELAKQIGEELAGAARIAKVEAVVWPNSALGFPKPGMIYTQALEPGHRVIFMMENGDTFECHSSASRAVLD